MNKKTSQNYNILLLVPIIMICTLVSIFIIDNKRIPYKYVWIWLLPVSFMVFSILFNRLYLLLGKSITITLLISLMFFKNVVTPCIMALGDGAFLSKVNVRPHMLYAIGLEIYEEFAIFLLMNIMYKKSKNALKNTSLKPLELEKTKIKMFNRITIIMLCIVLACIILFPQLSSFFILGISGDTAKNISIAQSRLAMRSSVPTIIYYSYVQLATILRWILPISVIYNLYISKSFNEKFKIITSLIVICFSVIWTTETIATSVFIAVALTLLISRIYIKQKKKILFISLGAIGVVAILALLLKSFGSGGIQSASYGRIASTLQAYFSGLENIAIANMIPNTISINEAIGDIFRFIPYVMHFFKDFTTSNMQFNFIYFESPDMVTQIIPMISQGARYFSFFFAPVFTIIFGWTAFHWEIKAMNRNTLFDYTLCVIGCVCFSMAIVMYSASLGLQLYLNQIVPIQFTFWFIHKFVTDKNYSENLLKQV